MAFGIAPLAVPLIMGMSAGFDGAPQSAVVVIAIFSLMFSYFVTLVCSVCHFMHFCTRTGTPISGWPPVLAWSLALPRSIWRIRGLACL
jgi:hypothetical protein